MGSARQEKKSLAAQLSRNPKRERAAPMRALDNLPPEISEQRCRARVIRLRNGERPPRAARKAGGATSERVT